MAEDESDVNEDTMTGRDEPNFLADDGVDLGDEDLDLALNDDIGMSLSFGGGRDYEE